MTAREAVQAEAHSPSDLAVRSMWCSAEAIMPCRKREVAQQQSMVALHRLGRENRELHRQLQQQVRARIVDLTAGLTAGGPSGGGRAGGSEGGEADEAARGQE
ncbi:hypothetical protein TSOC_005853 [Tetrabaena socialis]|uniref:Uncharacterized protein n=1 Tax=Tetrabaena socialis TaxID=47790 RepID=A0A2J8A587_9CHLO|nr:hypothetical protein TSOC_005853 [Tetrabaena socialis]|eukprot:PNH07702.1 hypothetical protein TSOC_005853 [Tetrabaena socialis]